VGVSIKVVPTKTIKVVSAKTIKVVPLRLKGVGYGGNSIKVEGR
jgi:hypothetical protein